MDPTQSLPAETTSDGQWLRTLRILVLAMALGVAVFAIVAVIQNIHKPLVVAGRLQPFNIVLLGMGLAAIPLGLVLPAMIASSNRGTPNKDAPNRGASPALAAPAKTPNEARRMAIQQRIQTSTIIVCAIFEGGAFANLVGYLQTGELLHLIVAGVLLLGILSRFPTAGAYERQIEDELRRMQDEEAFKSSG
jgi:hypothetical protein